MTDSEVADKAKRAINIARRTIREGTGASTPGPDTILKLAVKVYDDLEPKKE